MGGTRAVAPIILFLVVASSWGSHRSHGAVVTVEIRSIVPNDDYSPDPVTIKAGSSVTWHNVDDALHTATFQGGQDTGNIRPGEKKTLTFNTPGTFDYICTYHLSMEGRLIVESSQANPPPPASASPSATSSSRGSPKTVSPSPGQSPSPGGSPTTPDESPSPMSSPPIAQGEDRAGGPVERTAADGDTGAGSQAPGILALALVIATAAGQAAVWRMKLR